MAAAESKYYTAESLTQRRLTGNEICSTRVMTAKLTFTEKANSPQGFQSVIGIQPSPRTLPA